MRSCELLSNFLYFCSRNNIVLIFVGQILLWIALKFFVLLQSKQRITVFQAWPSRCELLSNFLYFCSRNNKVRLANTFWAVVNCSQIFCTFAVETTERNEGGARGALWIALKFFVLLQSKQHASNALVTFRRCELLSNFLYFCSRNNGLRNVFLIHLVVNCSQIFCTFAVETTKSRGVRHNVQLWIALKFFVLLQSKQHFHHHLCSRMVVNCSQIFCTFAVETTEFLRDGLVI